MNPLLARASARFYLRHPTQALLALAGIGLGVAVFIGVTLAIDSATRAFEQSAAFIRGSATHRLLPVGRALTDATYVELARTLGARAAPVLEAQVRIDSTSGRTATLLGIDPVEELGFRDFTRFAPAGDAAGIDRLIVERNVVLTAPALLEGRAQATPLRIVTDAGEFTLDVIGTLAADASADLIVADIGTAQELTGQLGILSRIDLILTPAQTRALEAELPAATALVSASNENAAFVELSRAFEINVSALGLLALVVGAFLIYSTMTFAVVQRRKPLAILRALGVSRREILLALGIEAIGIGALGALVGVALGTWLAGTLVGGVTATIDDFAFRSAVGVVGPSPGLYVQGCALGLAATLVAAIRPLLEAARIDPTLAMQRTAAEHISAERVRRAPIAAAALALAAAALLWLPTRSLAVAFAGLACVLAAGAAIAPTIIVAVARWAEPAFARLGGLSATMAARNVRAHSSRIAVATAALTLAVATVIGVGLMISSFRASLTRWLDTTLTSDIFISADAPFDPRQIVERIGNVPEVDGVSRARFVELPTPYGTLGIRAFAPGRRGWGLHIVDGDEHATVTALAAGMHVAISEPFAYRNSLSRGDSLTLPTPNGARGFPIAGVYRDYNAGGASVTVPLALYRTQWGDNRVSTLGLELTSALPRERLAAAIEGQLDPDGVRITSTDMLKQISLRIFDRTFAVTNVLRTLAGIVAFLGMLSALLALQLERQQEIAILRAVGFPPRGISMLMLTETAITGIAAGLAAIPIGIVLAGLLVYVINERSFGWTMELIVRASPLVVGVAIAVGAALLAGIVPSLKGRALIKDTALQYE